MPEMPTVLIQAVPWEQQRVRNVKAIRDQLIQENSDTTVIPVWDTTHNAFDTWRAVLTTAGENPVVIIEDDAILTTGFTDKIIPLIHEYPESVQQFFSMRGADETTGTRWEPGRTFLGNVCYYLPATYARQLLNYSEDWVEKNPRWKTGYDFTMAHWMRENSLTYRINVPSLVDHQSWVSSINSKRPRNRKAKVFEE